jgi:hypothetical protein
MKYRVGIILPAKLGMSMVMQAGEARTVCAAYKTAVLKAITCICEHKTEHLLGNRFNTSRTMRRTKIHVGIVVGSLRSTHMQYRSTWIDARTC